MLPKTYLSVAPKDADSMFGKEFTDTQIINGLRKINLSFQLETTSYNVACLWLGPPKIGKKICAFRRGAVPEFTQLGTGGTWMVRGWRSIFQKAIASRGATRQQIERQFAVVLEADGTDGSCVACRREGVLRAAEATGKRLCSAHQECNDVATSGSAKRRFILDQRSKLTSRRHQRRAVQEIQACLSGQ
jgi:hypothetical protein